MKKLIVIVILTLLQPLYGQTTTLKAEKVTKVCNRAQVDNWLEPPVNGQPKKKDNPIKVMLWRADKPRSSEHWRYEPHISSREYLDCSYYKYVNCEDIRFSRCWQCKDYYYDYIIREN